MKLNTVKKYYKQVLELENNPFKTIAKNANVVQCEDEFFLVNQNGDIEKVIWEWNGIKVFTKGQFKKELNQYAEDMGYSKLKDE
jgi:hypothetical protein